MLGAVDVNVTRDLADWILVVVAILSAFATVAAVLVALFGQEWWARRRAPKVRILPDPALGWMLPAHATVFQRATEMVLRLQNEPRREAARDVEVFATVDRLDDEGIATLAARYKTLNFDSPLDGHYGRSTATVPPGSERPVYVACIGDRTTIDEALYPPNPPTEQRSSEPVGCFAFYPARRDEILWMQPGEYRLTLLVSGSNFDAATYEGNIKFTIRPVHGELIPLFVDWSKPLSRKS